MLCGEVLRNLGFKPNINQHISAKKIRTCIDSSVLARCMKCKYQMQGT